MEVEEGQECASYVDALLAETKGLLDIIRMNWALMNNPGFLDRQVEVVMAKAIHHMDTNWAELVKYAPLLRKIKEILPEDFKAADLGDMATWTENLGLSKKVVTLVMDTLSTSTDDGEYYHFLNDIFWPKMFPMKFYAETIEVGKLLGLQRLRSKLKDRILACYPSFLVNDVHIIGCGGTGARLVPLVAQFMGLYYPEKTLHLWDGDTVEPKNLDRQLFVQNDIGKYKAAVLEKRYRVLHKKTVAHNRHYQRTSGRSLDNFSAVMIAVDSVEARRMIISSLRASPQQDSGKNYLVVDGGNTDSWGQVTTFTVVPNLRTQLESNTPLFEDKRLGLFDLGFAPVPYGMYSGPIAGTGISCGGMEQSMAINSLIASGMFASLQNWHFENPLLSSVVYYGLDGMVRSPITINEVLKDVEEWLDAGQAMT